MITRSYWHDESAVWAECDGPWRGEPDKEQWVDEATGLPCLLVRAALGHLCGYVGVGPQHPAHGVPWCSDDGDALPFQTMQVDYSDRCQVDVEEDYGICHVPDAGDETDVWWFGFAFCHIHDVVPFTAATAERHGLDYPGSGGYSSGPTVDIMRPTYKTVGFVRARCAELAAELVEWQEAGAVPTVVRDETLLSLVLRSWG